MTKYLRIGLVAVVALMLCATATMADARSNFWVVQIPNISEGQIYDADSIQVSPPSPAPSGLPSPQDPSDGNLGGASSGTTKAGPTMFDGHAGLNALGPKVGARAGGMLSAKQKADRQIRQLIHQLN